MILGDKMVTVDDIKTSLDTNTNLNAGIKENIFELVLVFQKNFPEVSLENLNNRLKTLDIKKINNFINHDVSMYDFRKNVLYFNAKEIENGYDMKHVLMFELLNIITATSYQLGFNVENKFEALNVGYTEMLANYLVGNDKDKFIYPEEAVETNLISIILGEEVLRKAYFTNDGSLIIKTFLEKGFKYE